MSSFLICFTGIDGTGKTTLAKWVSELLNKYNINNRYVWGSYEERINRPLITIFTKLLVKHKRTDNYIKYSTSVNQALKKPIVSVIYQLLTLTEYYLQIIFQVTLPIIFKKNTITDRYIYDTLINNAVNLGSLPAKLISRIRLFLLICPTPDVVFYLDAPPEVVIQRKNDIPSIEYEQKRRLLYSILAKEFGFIVLNAQLPLETLKYQLEEYLLPVLKKKH